MNTQYLTVEELKAFPGCENYTDEQAKNAVETLQVLSEILFQLSIEQNGTVIDKIHCIDNQSIKPKAA